MQFEVANHQLHPSLLPICQKEAFLSPSLTNLKFLQTHNTPISIYRSLGNTHKGFSSSTSYTLEPCCPSVTGREISAETPNNCFVLSAATRATDQDWKKNHNKIKQLNLARFHFQTTNIALTAVEINHKNRSLEWKEDWRETWLQEIPLFAPGWGKCPAPSCHQQSYSICRLTYQGSSWPGSVARFKGNSEAFKKVLRRQ